MLLSRSQLLAAQLVPQDERQPGLEFLRADPAGVVWATNSHYLIKVSAISLPGEGDFPAVMPATSLPVTAPVLIPRALALAVAKDIPKRASVNLPILGYAQLRTLPDDRAILAVIDRLRPPRLWYIEPQDNIFPNVEQVMKFDRKPLESPIGLSAQYLHDIADYAKKTGVNGRTTTIQWEFSSPMTAARFSWTTETGEEVDGLLMPKHLS